MNKIRMWTGTGVLTIALLIWHWEAPRFSGITEGKFTRLHQAIALEIQSLGNHEWAGEYCAGEGLGENVTLALAPRSGFVFERHGSGGLYDRNYGSVAVAGGRIKLSFKFKNNRSDTRGIASFFYPVKWGERHYLIPADDLAGFCDAIRSGREPRKIHLGHYLLRRGDEDKKVEGKPDLPGDYANYL